MGLKQDLIDAKLQAAKIAGSEIEEPTEAMEVEATLTAAAIVKFLTKANFTITELNANVILEDFKIPPQTGDIEPSVTTEISPGGIQVQGSPAAQQNIAPAHGMLKNTRNGVTTHNLNVSKYDGALESTGYVYIGQDPDSQGMFNVGDRDGMRRHTRVKLLLEDILELV